MPSVICQRHGGGIAPHGCRHVAERVWRYQQPGHTTFVDLDGLFFFGFICDDCLDFLNSHGLREFLGRRVGCKDYPSDEAIDPLIELVDFQPMCAKCFGELSAPSEHTTEQA